MFRRIWMRNVSSSIFCSTFQVSNFRTIQITSYSEDNERNLPPQFRPEVCGTFLCFSSLGFRCAFRIIFLSLHGRASPPVPSDGLYADFSWFRATWIQNYAPGSDGVEIRISQIGRIRIIAQVGGSFGPHSLVHI